MLIHWPGTSGKPVDDPNNAERPDGQLRAIGVSNYEIRHLEELLEHCKVHPAVNQVEFHPHFHQLDLYDYCMSHDIHFQVIYALTIIPLIDCAVHVMRWLAFAARLALMAYSSLGGPDYREELFSDPDVVELAAKYEITVPQFLLSWAISQSISVLPRSTSRERTITNFAAKDVRISKEDIEKLWKNGKCHKASWDPSVVV
ncbi:oxidoreductase, aldo/keto reductase family protein [Teladorsagia circumcincta]|uniref:Oxidoreductase, aldo/keto reductase family protein n=1 Tax=Teladorsagia circumcincta TaxID=45464 RepID=A0A2G9UVF0_TELCI|nr:oxidoreductase, aldo/keto reductase family protein [Teladorsagia circumcincta]